MAQIITQANKHLLYTKDTGVWIADSAEVWKSAKILHDFEPQSKKLTVIDENDKETQLVVKESSELPHLRNPQILIGLNDLTSLSYLHEPGVLYNLNYRFTKYNTIYTYCGIVLVAINPYKELPIYNNEIIWAYRGQAMGNLDPHIFAVAEEAYTKMERDGTDQSIIVSGESGAGKTVSAKYAMRYFATVGGSQNETQIEKKVLASSPIMEAIGNAKTTRNDNSSRFGKYVELHFDSKFSIMGATMRTYLLEKSRTVFQSENEQNYHIFYQLCHSKDHPELSNLHLDDPDKFSYTKTNAKNSTPLNSNSNRHSFIETVEALNLLGFDTPNRKNFFKLLAAILHLGNVAIDGDTEFSTISKDDKSLLKFVQLLQVDFESTRQWLRHRKIVTGGESFVKGMSQKEAKFCRDALTKMLYAEAFNWIVDGINSAFETAQKRHKFIGVLDIYGFEIFQTNSFEQFCINYANEKLEQQFNQHVFKLEQEEYIKEGIDWSFISYYDNQPCIQLIEAKLGILDLLDEECRVPQGSDLAWVQKLYSKCATSDKFAKPKMGTSAFNILHFADKVEYESTGFLEKNRDTVMPEQIRIVSESKNEWVRNLLQHQVESLAKTGRGSAGGNLVKKRTVGNQFRDSLNLLMTSLNNTTPHYIRCIKPNDQKKSFVFDPHRAVQQLRACGVLETIRISSAGFPSRWTLADFYGRYRVLCPSKDLRRGDIKFTCQKILINLYKKGEENEYRIGKTKLFFRAGQVALMEKLRHDKLTQCGITIQKYVKGWLQRKRYQKMLTTVHNLQKRSRGFLTRRKVQVIKSKMAAQEALQRKRKDSRKEKKIEEAEAYQALLQKFELVQSKLRANEEGAQIIFLLQQRLKRTQEENQRLEKLIQDMENESPLSETRRIQNMIRVQELEMENNKLKEDLSTLRGFVEIMSEDGALLATTELTRQWSKMEKELSRQQEESIQLKTILASFNRPNHPLSSRHNQFGAIDQADMRLVLHTQKQVLLHLEKELVEEKMLKKNLENQLRSQINQLQLANDTQEFPIEGDAVVSTNEIKLQYGVQKLTTENLNLLEKVSTLERKMRVLERQLRARKVGQHLGMLEYADGAQIKIIHSLLWNLEPKITLLYLPARLPAFIIFMCIRYADHLNDDQKVQFLLSELITGLKDLLREKGENNLEIFPLWLSNLLQLLQLIRQYGGNSEFQMENTQEQNEQTLRNFDLIEHSEIMSELVEWIYTKLVKKLEASIKPLVVGAILEDDSGLGGQVTVSGSKVRSMTVHGNDPALEKPLESLLKQLNFIWGFLKSFHLDVQIIQQMFRQLLYYICAGALNNLLLRKDLCHWSKGMQIRHNIFMLEEWCRKKKLEPHLLATLQPLVEASQLLQARKTDKDVDSLCDLCRELNCDQVVKLLNLYTPADTFEEPIPRGLIHQIQIKLGKSRSKLDNLNSTLLMDTKFIFDVEIPFNSSNVSFEDIEIPDAFGLSGVVKRL